MATTEPPAQPLLPAPEAPKLLPAPAGAAASAPRAAGWRRHAKAILGCGLAVLLLLAFGAGWWLHHRRSSAAEDTQQAEQDAMPMVAVVQVRRSPTTGNLLLPGSLSPITQASLFARASGYLKRRYVDLGDVVKKGQVLAEIESPELDAQLVQGLAVTAQARQQLNQARAAVGDATARLDLSRATWLRSEALLRENAIARQETELHRQEYESAQAMRVSAEANVGAAAENVRAAEANQRRLRALQQFEKLRAPFDGVITARSVDEGSLIGSGGASMSGGGGSSSGATASSGGGTSAGGGSSSGGSSTSGGDSGGSAAASGGGAGGELFRIAQVDRLRVYVSVPQENASAVQVGAAASVLLQEFDRPFAGRVTRTSQAIDPASRTLLAEVQIDNAARTLLPGMFAQVRFSSARSNPPLLVPGEALMAGADGMRVAVVRRPDDAARRGLGETPDARCARQVHLQPVAVGRDYGTQIEVASGLRDGDFLVLNPGDEAADEAVVLPRLQPAEGAGGSGAGGGGSGARGGPGGSASGGASPAGGGSAAFAAGQSGAGKANDDDKEKPTGGQGGQGGKGGDRGGKDGKDRPDEQKQRRAQARRTCIEEQVSAAAASAGASAPASAPAGQAAPASGGAGQGGQNPGGPSDRQPAGIQSPSMAAPTQGRIGGQNGQKGQTGQGRPSGDGKG